jgi:hypothetical protein
MTASRLRLAFMLVALVVAPRVSLADTVAPGADNTPATLTPQTATTDASDAAPATGAPQGIPSARQRTEGGIQGPILLAEPTPDRKAQVEASVDEGIKVKSGDGNFEMTVTVLLQGRYELGFGNNNALAAAPGAGSGSLSGSGTGLGIDLQRSNFQLMMVRPVLKGHLIRPWIRYFIQPELATKAPRFLDLQIDIMPIDEIGLRFGQFLTPYSRTFLTPIPLLQFPDFSAANTYFRTDRDTGAMLLGMPFKGYMEYYLGVFNGNGIDQGLKDNTNMMYEARLVANPLGKVAYNETPSLTGPVPFRMAIGLDGFMSTVTPTTTVAVLPAGTTAAATAPTNLDVKDISGATYDLKSAGADIALYYDQFTFFVEGYWRRKTPQVATGTPVRQDSWGTTVQTGYFVLPRMLELGARFSYIDLDTTKSNDTIRTYEGLVTYYLHGNQAKFHLRYSRIDADGGVANLPSNLTIKPGANNIVMLQFQLWI